MSHVPAVYREGKRVSVRLRLPSGEERMLDFAAHERVPVRRPELSDFPRGLIRRCPVVHPSPDSQRRFQGPRSST